MFAIYLQYIYLYLDTLYIYLDTLYIYLDTLYIYTLYIYIHYIYTLYIYIYTLYIYIYKCECYIILYYIYIYIYIYVHMATLASWQSPAFLAAILVSAGAIEDCALGVAVLALNALPQAELRWGTRTGFAGDGPLCFGH